jgi:hypothetical protein
MSEQQWRTCQTCAAWRPMADDEDKDAAEGGVEGMEAGECRFNPPQIDPNGDQFNADGQFGVWPLTLSTDWCRQHQEAVIGVPHG